MKILKKIGAIIDLCGTTDSSILKTVYIFITLMHSLRLLYKNKRTSGLLKKIRTHVFCNKQVMKDAFESLREIH